jgi:branched-chain amino acid transport system ATP-binding protein
MPEGPKPASLLAVRELNAWYGESHILHGVAFDVAAGEVVTLLGRNGAGKTTTMKSIMGIVGLTGLRILGLRCVRRSVGFFPA